jgi:hypothetical protein
MVLAITIVWCFFLVGLLLSLSWWWKSGEKYSQHYSYHVGASEYDDMVLWDHRQTMAAWSVIFFLFGLFVLSIALFLV